jgi:ribosomal protein L3
MYQVLKSEKVSGELQTSRFLAGVGQATHGQHNLRAPGSIGDHIQHVYSKEWRRGQMGNEKVKVENSKNT